MHQENDTAKSDENFFVLCPGGCDVHVKRIIPKWVFPRSTNGTLEFQRCSPAKKSGHCQTKKKSIFFGRTFKLEQNLQVFMTFETFGEAQGGLYLDHSKHLFLTVIE